MTHRVITSLVALVSACSLSAFDSAPLSPVPASPPEDVVFDVFRNGASFGEHRIDFEATGPNGFTAEVDISLRAGVGPLTLFRYEHNSAEVWRGGELQSVTGSTLKDGDRLTYEVDGADPVLDLVPSSHWAGYEPGTDQVLNTETGEVMDVAVEDLGLVSFESANGIVEARHIRLSGSLTVDLWYDSEGRWIGCEFEARGQTIRYVRRTA
ncbi:DUF6134 family protein [Maricaulis sp. CAU 1757]